MFLSNVEMTTKDKLKVLRYIIHNEGLDEASFTDFDVILNKQGEYTFIKYYLEYMDFDCQTRLEFNKWCIKDFERLFRDDNYDLLMLKREISEFLDGMKITGLQNLSQIRSKIGDINNSLDKNIKNYNSRLDKFIVEIEKLPKDSVMEVDDSDLDLAESLIEPRTEFYSGAVTLSGNKLTLRPNNYDHKDDYYDLMRFIVTKDFDGDFSSGRQVFFSGAEYYYKDFI